MTILGNKSHNMPHVYPVCSGKFAICDAGFAYDKAKPWIVDQAKKTKKNLDQFIEKYGTKDQTPDPQNKTDSNSI